ncbi:MAG: VOC family protein [Chloroflexota bacterium]|nr:VOC family protein [Chloroflexota bacterium]
MEPRISIITLGVTDLERSMVFYRDGLGFPVHEAGGPSITFFALGDMMLSLYPRDALMAEANPGQADAGQAPHAFTVAHNVASRAEVDAVLAQAEAAGAQIVKPASETFWGGYSGYFADPDGFRWEVATGSGLPVDPSAC